MKKNQGIQLTVDGEAVAPRQPDAEFPPDPSSERVVEQPEAGGMGQAAMGAEGPENAVQDRTEAVE